MHNSSFLVAVDNPVTKILIKSTLRQKFGIPNIFATGSGSEAIELLHKNDIDFIIADWTLDSVSGRELLEKVRSDSGTAKLPFIMLTSELDNINAFELKSLGATRHLQKPLNPEELTQSIKSSWNSADKRQATRHFDLPLCEAVLSAGLKEFPLEIINISLTGALFKLLYSENLHIYKEYNLKITANAGDSKIFHIDPLRGKSIRIEKERCTRSTPGKKCYLSATGAACNTDTCTIASIAFAFSNKDMDEESAKNLSAFEKWLSSRDPGLVNLTNGEAVT